jgi:aspartate/methionine/tyrosine aminotransferase
MLKTPIDADIVRAQIQKSGLSMVGLASIRELNRLVNEIERASGQAFIRMEMGIPGLASPKIAVDAEIEALRSGVGAKYPPFDGIPALKQEIARLILNFIGVTVHPKACFPTVGAMQGSFLAIMVTARRLRGKSKILFLDPGFPVNKLQVRALGLEYERFDIHDFRAERLGPKLESYLARAEIGALLYSNPNNPSWICLSENELKTIGELCQRHDVVALEDLAYLGMDFRTDYSQPGTPPFIPSVARYTDKYILLISASKSFSLAGQRIGMTAISEALFNSSSDNLFDFFGSRHFGDAYLFGGIYGLSAGVGHSAQFGLTALLKAVNDGSYNFVAAVREYGERARTMKRLFLENGFSLVYETDDRLPLADGFYFTLAYPGFSGVELVEELLYYGISAISLATTGSDRLEGIRACVSLTGSDRFGLLSRRLRQFNCDHRKGMRLIRQSLQK